MTIIIMYTLERIIIMPSYPLTIIKASVRATGEASWKCRRVTGNTPSYLLYNKPAVAGLSSMQLYRGDSTEVSKRRVVSVFHRALSP